MLGDRIDATGARLRSYATRRPDNLLAETGVLSAPERHPLRVRARRVDRRHQVLDPVIVAGPAALRVVGMLVIGRAVLRRTRHRAD
jgi:hypothetical protein